MSSCKLSCVRKQKQKQKSEVSSDVDGDQEAVEGSDSQRSMTTAPNQQLPNTSSGRSPADASSPRLKGLCKQQSCPESCPKPLNTIKDKLVIIWRTAKDLWKKTNDPFHWQLFKSVTMFTLGLKLFNDLYRHMTKLPVNSK